MNLIKLSNYIFYFIFLFASSITFAAPHTHKHGGSCSHSLVQPNGEVQLIMSGRDGETRNFFEKAVQEIFGKGGVAEKMGLANPEHVVQMVNGDELMLLATLGRHPFPHWTDGRDLVTTGTSHAGVLEFVVPGCPSCSMYTDLNGQIEQVSTLFHVAGHNDFSSTSINARKRNTDPMRNSLQMADLIEVASTQTSPIDVSRYVQWLYSFKYLQDFDRYTFDEPLTFTASEHARALKEKIALHLKAGLQNPSFEKNPSEVTLNFPSAPTPNILQAIVHNLPKEAADWQKDITKKFEELLRIYGFYAANKIMNEGWATLMEEILAGHSESFTTDEYSFINADLTSHVVGFPGQQRLSNPYYLGRLCWQLLREKFNKKFEADNQELRQGDTRDYALARDRAFISYAREKIAKLSDYYFVKEALDEDWVIKNNLALTRVAVGREIDPNLPPPTDPTIPVEQNVVVSRDPKRIVQFIANRFTDRTHAIPTIKLEAFEAFNRGVFLQRHENVSHLVLDLPQAAQTLYVQTKVLSKAASLKTFMIEIMVNPKNRFAEYLNAIKEFSYEYYLSSLESWVQHGWIQEKVCG
jgi:spore cortex formation protein SpoVR/YcgB (stage V sporulation)